VGVPGLPKSCERELMMTFGILLFGLLQLSAADPVKLPPGGVDRIALEKMPEEEKMAYLKALDEQILKLRDQRLKAEQERQASLDAMQKQTAPAEHAETPPLYQIDPLLKKAYLMFQDFDHRNRDEAVATFEEYIRENPDSVFLPQVYHCMGVMFCGNDNPKNGEKVDFAKMREYYQKARQAFRGKFCVDAMLVEDHLAFIGGTFDDQLKFYDWLRYMEEKGTTDDLYSVLPIGSCISGFGPQRSPKSLEGMLHNIKADILPMEIPALEKQLFQNAFQSGRDTYMELSIMAKRYPDTELGRQARHALDQIEDKGGLHGAVFDLNAAEVADGNSPPEPNRLQEPPKARPEGQAIPAVPKTLASKHGIPSPFVLLGAAGVVLALGAVLLVRSRKGRMGCAVLSKNQPAHTEQ